MLPLPIILKKVKLTTKQKHERHQIYVSSALAAAAAAARDGATQDAAIEFGKKEGAKNASSWADIARSGNALANKYNANFPELHGTGRINNANKTKKKEMGYPKSHLLHGALVHQLLIIALPPKSHLT